MGKKKVLEEGSGKKIYLALSSLEKFASYVNSDLNLEEVKQAPMRILGRVVESITIKDEEGARKYLKNYKKLSEVYNDGLDFIDSELDKDYLQIKDIFKNLKKAGHFTLNGESPDSHRPYE